MPRTLHKVGGGAAAASTAASMDVDGAKAPAMPPAASPAARPRPPSAAASAPKSAAAVTAPLPPRPLHSQATPMDLSPPLMTLALTSATAAPAAVTPPTRGASKKSHSSQGIPQTLPCRNGRYYFEHDKFYAASTEFLAEDGSIIKRKIKYSGQWTIMCKKPHTHTTSCKPQEATGFGISQYREDGKDIEEEGFFRRGILVTGDDSSDTDVPSDSDSDEQDEDYPEMQTDATVDTDERSTITSETDPSVAEVAAPAAPAKPAAASVKPSKRPSSGNGLMAPRKRAHSPDSVTSNDSPVVTPATKKVKAKKSSSRALKSREEPITITADCVLFRHESAAKNRILTEPEASAFEQAAAQAAETRSRQGKAPLRQWASDSWTYRGSMTNGQRVGFGTTTFDCGSVYKGQYQNDQCNGSGVWCHWDATGKPSRYEGGWVNDVEHGEGVLTHENEDVGRLTCKGTFSSGEMDGPGEWTLNSGLVYFKGTLTQGEFKEGRLNLVEPPGEFYEGTFSRQQFHGQLNHFETEGRMVMIESYFGDSASVLLTGAGCRRYADGSYFFGTFMNHDRHGPGLALMPADTDSDTTTSSSDASEFRVYPAIYKNDQVISRWVRREEPTDEENTPTVATSTPDEETVWTYVRQLISDGLKKVAHLDHEVQAAEAAEAGAPSPKKLTARSVASLVETHLAHFSSPQLFRLISIPMSVYNAARRHVCVYRISSEAGCPCQPYLCHTCSQDDEPMEACAETGSCHRGHSLTAQPPSREFVCECGRTHEAGGDHECGGMLPTTTNFLDLAALPKVVVQFVQQQQARQQAQAAAQ